MRISMDVALFLSWVIGSGVLGFGLGAGVRFVRAVFRAARRA